MTIVLKTTGLKVETRPFVAHVPSAEETKLLGNNVAYVAHICPGCSETNVPVIIDMSPGGLMIILHEKSTSIGDCPCSYGGEPVELLPVKVRKKCCC